MRRKRLDTVERTGLYEVDKRLDRIERIVGILVDSLDELRDVVRQERARERLKREEQKP